MALYQPGQGLNPAAIARLRGRKDVNKVFNDLPAEDYSKQWDSLLGQGAKKKLRCSHCTRPLKAEDSSARHLLCERCLPERHLEGSPLLEEEEGLILRHKAPPAPTREPRFLHLDSCTETAQARLESLPQTPSTAAANSEEDAEALSGEPSQPPPNDVVVTLKQRLLGIWIGPKGEQYNLSLSPAEPGILCSKKEKEDSPTAERIPLFLDVRDKLVWWGNNRSYFLDLTELTEQNDRLLWHDSGNGTAQEPKMEWKRVPSGAGEETVKTVRVKRWSPKPEVEVPLVEVPLKKNSNKISNKIPQVDRQEAEVRPKVIEPESQLVVKGGSPIQEVKQKSVPSQQKAETKLQVQPEQKEDFKASKVSSSSSGPMRKVPSTAKEVQSEKKVSGWRSAPSAEVWRPESRMEVDSKKRVVPTPSKKDVKGEHETTQEVKVWKPVETPKEEEKAKTAEPKQEAKVWRPVETPKEEVKAKTAEPKQEAKVWRPVETPKEEVKAKTAEPKQEAKVWRPVETLKEEVKAKTAEPKQEAKAKQEAKVWKVVQAPEEVRPVKPKEVPQSKQEVKVWRAVGEKDPPKETQKWEEKKHEKKLGKDSWIESWKDPETALADSAIKEITAQVMVPENKGFVWVDEWQERFSSTFGTVREFLESRPDKFLVTPTTGRGYRVALVKHEGPLKWKPRKHS